MADKQDLAPEKVRIKDSYRERIFAESQKLDKSYLDTLYFIVDCYFVFIKAGLPLQLMANTLTNAESNKFPSRGKSSESDTSRHATAVSLARKGLQK